MLPIFNGSKTKSFMPKLTLCASLLGAAIVSVWPLSAQAQYRWGADPRDVYDGPYGPYGYGERDPYFGPYGYRHRAYDETPEEADLGPAGESSPSDALHARTPRAGSTQVTAPQVTAPHKSAGVVPLETIQKQVRAAGYRLIATPRHDGKIYLAEAEDNDALRHRLVYDALDGHIIENTVLGPAKKPVLDKARTSKQDR
jgi:hypothetical protein